MSVAKVKLQNAVTLRDPVTPTIEPLLSLDDFAGIVRASRRTVERLRAAGELPKPDLHVGKMPRWRPETIRLWLARQTKNN
jgi:predicted DNA-binding transcriptional regulator AlpA